VGDGETPRSNGDPALSLIDVALRVVPHRLDGVDIDAMHMVLLLHRVTNAVVYDLETNVHRPGGWSWSAFRLLFTLWVDGPLDSKDAAARTGMSRPAVTSLVKTLVTQQLVQRDESPADGRSVVLSLTAKGQRELELVYSNHNARESQWIASLNDTDRVSLLRILGQLAETAQSSWVSHRT
jgi:MarR family transcriptional regulator, negative regulator of the multidrug operon emrRAB